MVKRILTQANRNSDVLGLDMGRQYVKMVTADKTKEGYRILDAGSRLVDANSAYDPEKIDRSHWVMAENYSSSKI